MSMFPTRSRLLDELMGDLGGFYIKPLHGDPLPQSIKVDIEETGDVYKVQAELPGVKKDDIHVEIDGAVVSIKAEIQQKTAPAKAAVTCTANATTAVFHAALNCQLRLT